MSEKIISELFSWIKSLFVALVIVFICRQFIFSPSIVYGESMEPTFRDQDRVIVSKISDIDRFDIIVFNAPDSDEYYIKRVIGLPGDTIYMKDDVLYINGEAYDESYLDSNRYLDGFAKLTGDFTLEQLTGESKVPENCYFVLGDNRLRSKDSRVFGFVPFDDVHGEVKMQIYPFSKISIIN